MFEQNKMTWSIKLYGHNYIIFSFYHSNLNQGLNGTIHILLHENYIPMVVFFIIIILAIE